MKRGEIYFIKSTYREEGSEQRADRPAVIVSNDKNNEHSETIEVVYLTTRPKTDLPTHVFTRSALSPSTILCEQICTVSKQRVETMIGRLTDNELKAVDNALAISLGIDFGQTKRDCPADCHGVVPIMREPTAEELEKLLDEMKRPENRKLELFQPDLSAELIKAQAERDTYKALYMDLLKHMIGGTE